MEKVHLGRFTIHLKSGHMMCAASKDRISLHFSEHEIPGKIDGDFIGPRSQRFVRLHEFFTDRNALGTVLLAFSALYALIRKGRLSGQADSLDKLGSALAF